jgi:hypothetical protein
VPLAGTVLFFSKFGIKTTRAEAKYLDPLLGTYIGVDLIKWYPLYKHRLYYIITTMELVTLPAVVRQFAVYGDFESVVPYGGRHINDTFVSSWNQTNR